MTTVLILGSAPSVMAARAFDRAPFDVIIAINNAWAVRPDWNVLIHPWDFPADRMPPETDGDQIIVTEDDFVPAQNAYGGFVYAGATMAFTAGYWALFHYKPSVLAFAGCDMTYPKSGATHFYGSGQPDPLRPDITLQSLEAKSARLMALGARDGTTVVNLSTEPSRLLFPRAAPQQIRQAVPYPVNQDIAQAALDREAALGYFVPSGRYWEEADRFDPAALAILDKLWLASAAPAV